eukprot:g2415.t1
MRPIMGTVWFIFDKTNAFFEGVRSVFVEYAAQVVNKAIKGIMTALVRQDIFEVESKVQELKKTEFPPLSRNSLSFFDNFQILNGIPVFPLRPTNWRDFSEVCQCLPGSSRKHSTSSPVEINWNEMFRTQCQIICTTFSPDSSLLVSGHYDGSIMVWDAEHGTLKRLIKGVHAVQVADLAFYSDSSKFLLACDFSGTMSIHDVSDEGNEPIIVNCGSNYEKTRMPSVEGQWPKFCPQGKLLICPVQVVVENQPNRTRGGGEATSTRIFSRSYYQRFGVSVDTFDTVPNRSGADFSHFCILHIFNTRDQDHIVRNSVYGDAEGRAYNWGTSINLPTMQKVYIPVQRDSHDYTLSSTEISYDSKGLLIGVNSRPQGHLILWPDFKERPLYSYRLEGMVGRWSPCNTMIVSWDVPLESSPDFALGTCRIWQTSTLLQSSDRCYQNGESDHPRYIGTAKCTLHCPSGNPIYWCDFVLISPGVIGMASCSVGAEVKIVLWDVDNKVPVQTFHTGMKGSDIRLGMQQSWSDKWVSAKPSWGLNPISTSQDRNRIGIFSLVTNKGIIWDTEKRIQKLWISVNNKEGLQDPDLTSEMDFRLSPTGKKFVTVNEDTIMIWCPQQLHSKEERGSSWVSLTSSDPELSRGKLRCKFTPDGNFIGLMRLFCTVMDVWDLSNGMHHVLKLPAEEPVFSEESEREDSNLSAQWLLASAQTPSLSTAADKTKGFCQFCISQDGTQVVTCMGNNAVLLWDITSKKTDPVEIARLCSRYYAAWDVCFCNGDPNHSDLVIVCEDSGYLVWIDFSSQPVHIDRKDGGGTKRCTFSSDGSRAVLMPDDNQVRVWDLVYRQLLFQCTYNIWLGKSGIIKFPHNISFDGRCSLMGLDASGKSVLCHPSTTYSELRNWSPENRLVSVPNHVKVTGDMKWFVADQFQDLVFSHTPHIADTVPSSSNGTMQKSRSFQDCKQKTTGETRLNLQIVHDDPLQAIGGLAEYPDIRERLTNEYLWDYLRGRGPTVSPSDETNSDRLMIRSVDGKGTEKEVVLPGLSPEKFIVISDDGRRIACIGGDGNKLQIWTANAADGCIPTTQTLLHFAKTDVNYLTDQLERFGPGLLNQQDHSGLTLTLTAIYNKDVDLLRSIFSWAKANNMKISLRDKLSEHKEKESQTLNALNLALGSRSPEVTRLILKYLLDGVCTELETSEVLQDSLIRLSGVYPSILLRILDSRKVMLHLEELTVPEWAFAKSEYKVIASDELIPTPANLYKMWVTEGLEKQDGLFKRSEFKRASAYACVMPYPDIAEIGMNGILRPLLFNRVPHHIFATWPIRCVVKYKWGLYGKRLVIEDFMHYSALLFFFTLFTLLIGFLVNQDTQTALSDKFYRNSTNLLLIISVVLAVGSLIRKLLQIRELWSNKRWKGFFYWCYDYWNLLELCCYCFIVVIIPIAYIREIRSRLLAGALACSCVLLWCKTLYYAQAFKSTGPLVIMIREIVKDIRFHLFLMFAILMGFTIAFFVLFRNARFESCNDRANPAECQSTQKDIADLFGTFDRTLVTMFSMILGEVSDVSSLLFTIDEGLKFVGIVMFTLYMLAVTIVLLNLLIAIMGDGFDRVKATDMSYFLQKRAQIIDDMESMLTKERSEALSKTITKYLHVLLPKYKSDTQMQTSEWQGRMRDAQDRFKQEVMKMFNQFSCHLATVTENQVLLANRIEDLIQGLSDPTQLTRMSSMLRNSTSGRGRMVLETLEPDQGSDLDDIFEKESLPDTI